MELIEKLADKISEEIGDAKCYATMALQYRENYPEMARTLYNISLEEMDHMRRLHEAAEKVIEIYRETKGEPPADMLAVYNYLHKRQIDQAAEAKILQAMYKDG